MAKEATVSSPDDEGGAVRQDDLLGRPAPRGDWGEPVERLDELYQWVEARALRTVDWYLRDRHGKKRAAQVLRAVAAVGVVAAAALPLVDVAGVWAGAGEWGYLALLGAVACLGADRAFGLTAGWMRDVAVAQAVQRRLEALQFDWASESVREQLGPTDGSAGEAAERSLAVLRRFTEDVSELVRAETADWMVAFRAGSAALMTQSLAWVRWPSVEGAGAQPRFPFPQPGVRAPMPRQRPPEPPR
ncbi:SLATT domain-containing protein [Streptomyces sp. A7024]|uniref:SLATT domain-containing protein n=1 Tax=Streptomyces coryli TaxID=1128680 RepID=A0A6G4U1T2_9ACTN|nr:SLATT domain-containing protein [Streptomyces coryli]NGN66043.1 SLATT domain-containing protein [Streptomyces coryli]